MTVATESKAIPAKAKAAPAKVAPAKPAKLTPEQVAKAATDIRNRWDIADRNEAQTLSIFEGAKLAFENARVIKTRVAYAAAMLTPFEGGANLLNAARILLTDPTASAAARTTKAKSTKNTLRNYVAAGEALDAKALAYADGEPTPEERDIVNRVFSDAAKAKAKAAKDAAKAAKAAKDSAPAADDADDADRTAGGEHEALTANDIIGHVGRMAATLKLMEDTDAVLTEAEASNIADMLADFTARMEVFAAGK